MWMKPTMCSCSPQAQPARDLGVVGRPAGEPLRAEAERLRGLQQGEADAAGAEQAFLLGDLLVRAEPGDDRDHQRRVREAQAVLLDRGLAGMRIALDAARGQALAQRMAGVAADGRNRQGVRLPWSGTRTAERSRRSSVASSGAGSVSCLAGTERRASSVARAAWRDRQR